MKKKTAKKMHNGKNTPSLEEKKLGMVDVSGKCTIKIVRPEEKRYYTELERLRKELDEIYLAVLDASKPEVYLVRSSTKKQSNKN